MNVTPDSKGLEVDLELVALIIIRALRLRSIVIDGDELFWEIDPSASLDLETEPELLTGNLRDDVVDLMRVQNGEQEPLSYHLQALGNVLRYLSGNVRLARD